jgi:hypothetical protein
VCCGAQLSSLHCQCVVAAGTSATVYKISQRLSCNVIRSRKVYTCKCKACATVLQNDLCVCSMFAGFSLQQLVVSSFSLSYCKVNQYVITSTISGLLYYRPHKEASMAQSLIRCTQFG